MFFENNSSDYEIFKKKALKRIHLIKEEYERHFKKILQTLNQQGDLFRDLSPKEKYEEIMGMIPLEFGKRG